MSLSVKELFKTHKKNIFFEACKAVRGISFEINKGESYALIGQNGSGKTTTIKCILEFIKHDKGEISFNNDKIHALKKQGKVGYLPEILLYPNGYTMYNYLIDISILKGMDINSAKKNITYLAEKFELLHVLNKPINSFSKGMKRKVGFIQAILGSPELLILDEPTDGLDPISRRKILEHIKTMKKDGTTVLITSHILSDLEVVSDKIGLMKDGLLIKETTFSDIFEQMQCHVTADVIDEDKVLKNKFVLYDGAKIKLTESVSLNIDSIDKYSNMLEDWYFKMLGGQYE